MYFLPLLTPCFLFVATKQQPLAVCGWWWRWANVARARWSEHFIVFIEELLFSITWLESKIRAKKRNKAQLAMKRVWCHWGKPALPSPTISLDPPSYSRWHLARRFRIIIPPTRANLTNWWCGSWTNRHRHWLSNTLLEELMLRCRKKRGILWLVFSPQMHDIMRRQWWRRTDHNLCSIRMFQERWQQMWRLCHCIIKACGICWCEIRHESLSKRC